MSGQVLSKNISKVGSHNDDQYIACKEYKGHSKTNLNLIFGHMVKKIFQF